MDNFIRGHTIKKCDDSIIIKYMDMLFNVIIIDGKYIVSSKNGAFAQVNQKNQLEKLKSYAL